MNSTTYQLQRSNYILPHWFGRSYVLRDLDQNPDNVARDALAASGDCFEMIASNLDQISHSLPPDHPLQYQLDHTIRTLLYLQNRYKITRKASAK